MTLITLIHLNKVDIFTDKKLGTLSGDFAPSGDPTLRFDPVDPNNFNYNVKVYRESFRTFYYSWNWFY